MRARAWAKTINGVSEGIAASFAFWWGAWVASPFWATFDSTPTFRVMADLAPAWLWGSLPMAAGLLLLRYSIMGNRTLKQHALLFLVAFFVFVFAVLTLGNPSSTAVPTYLHAAVMYGFMWYADRRRRG